MMRITGTVWAAIVVSRLVCTDALALPVTAPQAHRGPHLAMHVKAAHAGGMLAASYLRETQHAPPPAAAVLPQPPRDPLPALSPDLLSAQEHAVSQLAVANGDRTFLMVDKALGKILLFEDGKPVLLGNALTGESAADQLRPHELLERFARLNALEDKVTPAGRFTVTRGYDKEYGPLFDIKEIQGKDWEIAIHQVYLGIPSERRAARLQSPNDDDKNITFGCINVTPETIRVLLRELPAKGATALYVLPRDETRTAAYFMPRNS